MADGELTLKLDDDTAARLEAIADAAGRSVGDYVRELIAVDLNTDCFAQALEALNEYDRNGVSVPVEEALAAFRSALDERLARRS